MRLFRRGVVILTLFLSTSLCFAEEPTATVNNSAFISQPEIIVNGINNRQVTQLMLTKELQQKKLPSVDSLLKLTKQYSGGNSADPSIDYVKTLDDQQGIIPRGSGLTMKLGSLKNKYIKTINYADIAAHVTTDASWLGINIGW